MERLAVALGAFFKGPHHCWVFFLDHCLYVDPARGTDMGGFALGFCGVN